ncbi:MobV family relaxase [Hymenobacter convexus]|uniref:MobV family relaxase n=1 Tax=Hymenobacter sp. CA1UV-4 TaxID=3063782 RepID=UPI0027122EF8|nr:MobV family relaxase [Hymenobacter sp. CA1UV-4]MDO7854434.1 MobV family relaxase [Hymenobacter sp. CA1UV-4]
MPYAILRINKLKNLGTATSATQHNYRQQDTPNADPAWADSNQEYLNLERRNYWTLANERIAELHLPRLRSDAVRAVEVLLTASPEGFRRDADGRALDVRGTPWVQDNLDFLHQRFGKNNVVSFTLHQDEVTPHVHAVVVPVTADGRLSSRDVFSPSSLRQLQTDYGKVMEPHGLERGIRYSTALHEDVRRHYGAQQMCKEALADLAKPLSTVPHQLRPMASWENPQKHQALQQLELNTYIFNLTSTGNQKISQLAAVASANALERERAQVLEKQLGRSQEQLASAREGITPQVTRLKEQLRQAQEELATRTTELAEQKTRTAKGNLNHFRAVMKHLQGEPLSENLTAWGQSQRQTHQTGIERMLAKQLLKPIQQVADIAPAFLEKSYVVEITSPTSFTLTHEKNGMRFSSAELRPNGRDFLEQLREVVDKRQGRDQTGPNLSTGEIER